MGSVPPTFRLRILVPGFRFRDSQVSSSGTSRDRRHPDSPHSGQQPRPVRCDCLTSSAAFNGNAQLKFRDAIYQPGDRDASRCPTGDLRGGGRGSTGGRGQDPGPDDVRRHHRNRRGQDSWRWYWAGEFATSSIHNVRFLLNDGADWITSSGSPQRPRPSKAVLPTFLRSPGARYSGLTPDSTSASEGGRRPIRHSMTTKRGALHHRLCKFDVRRPACGCPAWRAWSGPSVEPTTPRRRRAVSVLHLDRACRRQGIETTATLPGCQCDPAGAASGIWPRRSRADRRYLFRRPGSRGAQPQRRATCAAGG